MHVNKIHSSGVVLNELVKVTIEKYSKIYFELNKRVSFIEKIKIEEEKFRNNRYWFIFVKQRN